MNNKGEVAAHSGIPVETGGQFESKKVTLERSEGNPDATLAPR
jgi:hypothetical protein